MELEDTIAESFGFYLNIPIVAAHRLYTVDENTFYIDHSLKTSPCVKIIRPTFKDTLMQI